MEEHIPNWKRLKTDPEYRERMMKRTEIIAAVRDFFLMRDFLEVETPTVVPHPGMEPNLAPFATEVRDVRGQGNRAGLITSPEYALKKLLAGGLPRIFQIAKSFRNDEPWSGLHNPEFTMIEWYRSAERYESIMIDVEDMVRSAAERVAGGTSIAYRGQLVDLFGPWERLAVTDAFDRFCGIDLAAGVEDVERFRSDIRALGFDVADDESFEDMFFRVFLRDIEPKLGLERPVILYEYPASMAALARLKDDDSRFAERFEVYIAGMELCNAFGELTDAAEQRMRFEKEQEERRSAGKDVYGIDEQFIEAVGQLPECSGVAFGLDRLVMLLTDAPDIRDVLFFPAADLFRDPE